ncbi:unnamed protein product [Allacma fusca]|uniref:Uncharacterized protein n=1 Tax=Allacma fusca TaxID=39272 RepID=A0A8J2KR12_9HEXA|nr:unnamed protein product [Allacma fusca]
MAYNIKRISRPNTQYSTRFLKFLKSSIINLDGVVMIAHTPTTLNKILQVSGLTLANRRFLKLLKSSINTFL